MIPGETHQTPGAARKVTVTPPKNAAEALVLQQQDDSIFKTFVQTFKDVSSSMNASKKEIGDAMKDATTNLASVNKLMTEEAISMKAKRIREKMQIIKEAIAESNEENEELHLRKKLKMAREEYLDL
jgi:uncharacterized protein YabN with tetrapyrrole methylase and pyrophosphatase domain